MAEGIYILGASGHAKVVLSVLEACGHRCLGFYDDDEMLWNTVFCGKPVFGAISQFPDEKGKRAIVAIGDNSVREKVVKNFANIDWVSLVHPKATVDKTVQIGMGTVVCAGVVIQPYAKIGNHTIINTSATVDHDCKIGDFTHIAPGCHLCGVVEVGNKVLLSVGTSVIPCIKIADGITVGAGASVINNITEAGIYVGTPEKKIK